MGHQLPPLTPWTNLDLDLDIDEGTAVAVRDATAANGTSSGSGSGSHKKLSHNAYERDRRKQLNELYLSLRSLLPDADHTVSSSYSSCVRACAGRRYDKMSADTREINQEINLDVCRRS